jgi:hypothetical protein
VSLDSDLLAQGSLGGLGSGSIPGQAPEFYLPRGVHAAPWSSNAVLVADSGNGRVVEVDVVQEVLVKVRERTRRSLEDASCFCACTTVL